ncbi:hypothetical protein Tco_0257213 [Tanacetum coccineum]
MPHRISIRDGRSLSLLEVFPDKHLFMIALKTMEKKERTHIPAKRSHGEREETEEKDEKHRKEQEDAEIWRREKEN